MLRKEVDKVEMSQYDGIEYDSDDEFREESDDEYQSDEDIERHICTYDIEKMFEIITKRDFNKWRLATLQHRYKQIKLGEAGRKQLSRQIFENK